MIINELAQAYLKQHPADAVRALENSSPAESAELLGEWPTKLAAAALGRMEPLVACAVLSKLPVGIQGTVLTSLEPHRSMALFRRMEDEERERLLEQLPEDKSRPLRLLLRYPEHTVGATMDPHYPSLPDDLPLTDALDRVRKAKDRVTVFWFVINREQELIGVVSVRDLLAPEAKLKVGDVMRRGGQRLSALTDIDRILGSSELNRLHALPVTDERGIYLGAIRQEAVMGLTELEDQESESVQVAGSALGELYRLGLFGLVYSIEGKSDNAVSNKE